MTATQTNGAAQAPVEVHIERLQRQTIHVPIEGITPLIVHAWDPKMRAALPGGENSSKKGRKKMEHPTAEEAYEASRYRCPDGTDGFPGAGFKAAIVDSYYLFDGLVKKQLKTLIFVGGVGPEQLVPIVGEPQMREDVVRIGMGTANLRHRAMYPEWSAVLPITFLPSQISHQSVLALVDAAGLGGIGEWRPSAPKSTTGTYGQFRLTEDDA